jgi:hypothetical protein
MKLWLAKTFTRNSDLLALLPNNIFDVTISDYIFNSFSNLITNSLHKTLAIDGTFSFIVLSSIYNDVRHTYLVIVLKEGASVNSPHHS